MSACLLTSFSPVGAQAPTPARPALLLTGITSNFVSAPNLGSTLADIPAAPSDEDTNKWLKVEFTYEVDPQVRGDYLDEATFKVWVEGRDPLDPQAQTAEGLAVMLTGEETYELIPRTKGPAYGCFFVHPDALKRYSAKTHKGTALFLKEYDVHVQALVGGTVVSEMDRNKNEPTLDWYMAAGIRAVKGFVFNQLQSPFGSFDKDRYPMLKLPDPVTK